MQKGLLCTNCGKEVLLKSREIRLASSGLNVKKGNLSKQLLEVSNKEIYVQEN